MIGYDIVIIIFLLTNRSAYVWCQRKLHTVPHTYRHVCATTLLVAAGKQHASSDLWYTSWLAHIVLRPSSRWTHYALALIRPSYI